MNTKVCMFVWNHFTNDARVLRECTTLSENGYDIDLICIDNPNDPDLPKYERRNEHFEVYRVRRYPVTLLALQRFYRRCKRKKRLGLLMTFLWVLLLYVIPIPLIALTVIASLMLNKKTKPLWIKGGIFIRMILKAWQKNYDIYHSNDLNTLTQGYITSKWRLKKGKLVYDSHEVQTSRTGYDSPYYRFYESFLIKRIDVMIVENHTRAKYNQDLYGFYPQVLHNYPFKHSPKEEDEVDLHAILGLPPDEKILLYQGGIQSGRGLDKLVEAVPLFSEGTLVLIGDGRIKGALQDEVKTRNLEDRVKFLPKVPLKKLPQYTKNAYLGFQVLNNVNFNHYSASSNKLFEYMMSGVPVIASNFPEISKVVKKEQTGILVDPHNYKEIAEAVNKLLSNHELRERYSKNSLIACNKYNWEKEKLGLLDIYRKVK